MRTVDQILLGYGGRISQLAHSFGQQFYQYRVFRSGHADKLFLLRHPLDFFTRFGRQVDRHEKLGKGYIVESADFAKGH